MMRHSRHEFFILRDAALYLRDAVTMYHIHRLSMVKIMAFYTPLAIAAFGIYGRYYPLDFGTFFWAQSSPVDILISGVPFVVFTGIMNTYIAIKIKRGVSHKIVACEVYKIQLRSNARAGIFEELVYRFMVLLIFIPALELVNFVLAGFTTERQGPLGWIHSSFMAEFLDSLTFGFLEEQMLGESWSLAFAILIANALFAKGHIYQGFAGLMHSWYMGFGFFYLTFSHGLLVAMIFHALLNSFVSTIGYADTHWDTRHIKRHKR